MAEIWSNLVNQIDGFLGLGKYNSEILAFVFCVLLILALFIIMISFFGKKSIKTRQKLVYHYDNIIYLISAYSYQTNTKDSLNVMNQVLVQKRLSYEESHSKIVKSIREIEKSFGKKIIPKSDWKKINKLKNKLNISLFLSKVLKILLLLTFVSVFILFVYNKN